MGNLTDAERELLTEDELAALEIDENELDEGEKETEAKPEDLPEPKKEEEPEKKPEAEDDPEKVEKPDQEIVDDPEKGADAKDNDIPADEAAEVEIPKVDFQPKIDTKMPDALKARIDEEAGKINAELEAKLGSLKEQYDNGDIDSTQYFDQTAPIREQISDNKAEVRDEMRSSWRDQQVSQQRWDAEQDAFFKIYPSYDAPKYEDNKLVSGNPVMYGALDAACTKVSKENPGISGIDLLIKAKAEVDAAMGVKPEANEDKGGKKPSAERPGKTLGDLPAAAKETAGEGEFAHLDLLSGDALEDALAKIPAEKRERYLAGE